MRRSLVWSGGSGIRTHGGLHLTAFQELRICPLCHPSHAPMLGDAPSRYSREALLPAARRTLVPQSSPHATAFGLGEDDLTETDDLGRHLDAFVVGNELERVL